MDKKGVINNGYEHLFAEDGKPSPLQAGGGCHLKSKEEIKLTLLKVKEMEILEIAKGI